MLEKGPLVRVPRSLRTDVEDMAKQGPSNLQTISLQVPALPLGGRNQASADEILFSDAKIITANKNSEYKRGHRNQLFLLVLYRESQGVILSISSNNLTFCPQIHLQFLS